MLVSAEALPPLGTPQTSQSVCISFYSGQVERTNSYHNTKHDRRPKYGGGLGGWSNRYLQWKRLAGTGKEAKRRKVQYFILKLKYPLSSRRADPFVSAFIRSAPPSHPAKSTKWSTQ